MLNFLFNLYYVYCHSSVIVVAVQVVQVIDHVVQAYYVGTHIIEQAKYVFKHGLIIT